MRLSLYHPLIGCLHSTIFGDPAISSSVMATEEDVRFYNISGNLDMIFRNLETDFLYGTPKLFCTADGENIRFGGW
jgi:hypothetical protein